MSEAHDRLLRAVVAEVGANGLGDRSLRDVAAAIGSSHRMLHYHFGSRSGLVAALVAFVERSQRELLIELADQVESPRELALALWRQVSSEQLRPFVRLFLECVGSTGGAGLTDPWIDLAATLSERFGAPVDPVDLRIGVAVSRGLLIDVLATGDTATATEAMERFVARWGDEN